MSAPLFSQGNIDSKIVRIFQLNNWTCSLYLTDLVYRTNFVKFKELNMPNLSSEQFMLVYNMLSLAIAAMLGSFVFFVIGRNQLAPKFRPAMVMSALVVGIAGYHYLRIFDSWNAAYALDAAGQYVATGLPFNDAYRYVDWLLTVPLLVAELVAVLALPKKKRGGLMAKLVIAAVFMIGLGYPGEVAADAGSRTAWGLASTRTGTTEKHPTFTTRHLGILPHCLLDAPARREWFKLSGSTSSRLQLGRYCRQVWLRNHDLQHRTGENGGRRHDRQLRNLNGT